MNQGVARRSSSILSQSRGSTSISNISRRKARKASVKSTTVGLYASALVLIVSVIAVGYRPPQEVASIATADKESSSVFASDTVASEVVATALAANMAEAANLPVANNVANLSVSLASKSELTAQSSTSAAVVAKPQIVQSNNDRRTIIAYTTKEGDTVESIAAAYGLSVNTVKWANNLTSDTVDAGKELKILPVDGIIYTVKDGDTVDSIAQKYGADKNRIVAFNDLELTTAAKDMQLIVPSGQLPETERPGYVAPRTYTATSSAGGVASASQLRAGSVGNRYAYGYCTWYAYERRPEIGSFWGNATSWAVNAQASGFTVVRGVPKAGSILQYGGGYGHVGIVESVDWESGTMTYSDMNGVAGWGRVGTKTVPIQTGWNYIY